MGKQYNHNQDVVKFSLDVVSLALAWGLSYVIRFYWLSPRGDFFYAEYLWAFVVIVVLYFFVFKSFGANSSYLQETPMPREIWHLFRNFSVSFALFLAISFFYRGYQFSRILAVLFCVLGLFFLTCNRIALRLSLEYLWSKGQARHTAIVLGNNELGRAIASGLAQDPWSRVEVFGFIDDRSGTEVLGPLSDLPRVIGEKNPDYLYIALPFSEYDKIHSIMESSAESTVSVRLVADIFSLPTLRSGIGYFWGYPLIHLTESPLNDGWNRMLKRCFDIVFSCLVLFFLSPLFAIIAVASKLSSAGPILYRQERMGLDRKLFRILKFRTMIDNAEASTGPVWAKPGDGRTTRFGNFLRKTSLDELPQFWNVLKGEMSVVGPRPERPVFIEKFKKEIPKYMLRHKMKAGITGWAQVNGWRGNTSLIKRIEHDLYYIENWSMSLDCKIVLLTVLRGFINRNAY